MPAVPFGVSDWRRGAGEGRAWAHRRRHTSSHGAALHAGRAPAREDTATRVTRHVMDAMQKP